MYSQTEENYLKSIYALQVELHSDISTNLIADKLQTKASSVTDMIKKLAMKKLVIYKKYQGVQLTITGKRVALKVIRKHRLWEYFLVEKLQFKWDEVHEIAEQLEHIQSEKLVDKLDGFLKNPKFDPHGDPIPDKKGKIIRKNSVNISSLKVGDGGVLESVKDSSEAFLKFLSNKKLALGDRIKVIDIEPFDSSIHIETGNKRMMISKKIGEKLFLNYKK
jgi:DtxR family transcriptional regulator, Mn-dependent transcriptional regulator